MSVSYREVYRLTEQVFAVKRQHKSKASNVQGTLIKPRFLASSVPAQPPFTSLSLTGTKRMSFTISQCNYLRGNELCIGSQGTCAIPAGELIYERGRAKAKAQYLYVPRAKTTSWGRSSIYGARSSFEKDAAIHG